MLFYLECLLSVYLRYELDFYQERARAAALGYPDPTNPSFEATSENYHRTLAECLRRIKELKDKGSNHNKIGIMVASHNEDTVRFAIEK